MAVKAIDVHVHLNDEETLAASGPRIQHMEKYFGRGTPPVAVDELADIYRSKNMMAVLQNTCDPTVTGRQPVPNDHIADAVRKHPDVFIGFGIVDPAMGRLAVDEVKRCGEELGLKGIGELNPGRQHFYPNDPRYYPVWEEIDRQGMVVLFHTGMAGAGAGTPGGLGVKLKYTRPIPYLDDIAADFPSLQIIGAHPAWPYQAESLAIARHKANFFIDLSGWAPKYFGDELRRYAGSILQDKMLFGTDWPLIAIDRWLKEFDDFGFSEQVKEKILVGNARKLFGLDS